MRWAVAATAIVVVSLAAACSGSSDLGTLQKEPVAALKLVSAEDPQRVELPGGEQFGKPSEAVLQLLFVPRQDFTFDDVLSEAVAESRDLGWTLGPESAGFYRGTKAADGGTMSLEVFVARESHAVVVQLEPWG